MERWRAVRRFFLVLLLGMTLGLVGCEGDDGDDGPPGPAGPPGPPGESAGEAQSRPDIVVIPAQITAATIPGGGGPPTVTFTVQDDNGQPVTTFTQESLAAGEVRFIVAKLLPPDPNGGEPANWRSYINRVERLTGTSPRLPSVPADNAAVQATTEANGTLVHNGNGSYTYTFATNLASVTDPLTNEPIPFEPSLPHRVAIQIEIEEEGEPVKVSNPTFDFIPAGGTAQSYRVAQTANCNECHDLLVAHGARYEIDYCVMCHNPFSADANSGNTVDMPVMVHKIHMGRELPSVLGDDGDLGTADDGRYVIWGFRNSEHDYSDVGYPQDVRYCTKCHEQSDAAPQGNNWRAEPTIANCGSCHDNILFNPTQQTLPPGITAVPHSGGVPVTDPQCALCHPGEGAGAGQSVTNAHTITAAAVSDDYQYEILGITNTAPGQNPVVTFRVLNRVTGQPSNILTDPEWTVSAGGASRLAVLIGWPSREFSNTGSGANPAQPISINPLSFTNATTPNPTPAVRNDDGSFTVTSPTPIPADVTGSGGVALEGHPAVNGERIPVRNAFRNFVITGTSAQARRQVVSIDKCNVCHNILSIHGNNRTNNIDVCVMCHNPNATDVAQRGADPGETPIDFKTMIHAIHGNTIRENTITIFGFGGTAHEFGGESASGEAVLYPGILQNCNKCHVEGGFNLPLENFVLATTTETNDVAVPTDDVNTSVNTAVCSSCHDNASAIAHMTQNGGDFALAGNATAADSAETCNICHATGRVAPVENVHAVFDVPVPTPEPVLGAGNIPAPPPVLSPVEPPPTQPPPAEPPPTEPPPAEPPPTEPPPTEPPPTGPDLAAGQAAYDGRCAGCHVLGTYDPDGFAPNLSGQGGDIPTRFPTPGTPGTGAHAGITLSEEEITNISAFVNSR